jgi:hypothetical protein
MATAQTKPSIFQELADLFAAHPTPKQLLRYRPSRPIQQRARTLLSKQGEGSLSYLEQRELDEFLHAEFFIRLVKAKLRAEEGTRS